MEKINWEKFEEFRISEFETIPTSPQLEKAIEKIQNVTEYKITVILNAIGLKEVNKKIRNEIVEFVVLAICQEEISFERISEKIGEEKTIFLRMTLAKMINEYTQKNRKNCKRIKVLDFLEDLKRVIKELN